MKQQWLRKTCFEERRYFSPAEGVAHGLVRGQRIRRRHQLDNHTVAHYCRYKSGLISPAEGVAHGLVRGKRIRRPAAGVPLRRVVPTVQQILHLFMRATTKPLKTTGAAVRKVARDVVPH